jgi:predicted  nucleic acid-binding Zn-ribbon protein
MHPGLNELLRVQTLDLKLAELAQELARFPRKLAEAEAPLAAARAALEKTREAQTASLKERKKLELDVESWKEKIRKYKDQTAQVKTNEAYRALVHEIEGAEAEIRKAEDKVLDHMEASEAHDRELKAGEKALAEAERTAKSAREQLAAAKSAIESEQTRLRAERESAAGAVPKALYERYQRYAPRHHGVAVATVDGETCSGCRVHLRPYVVQRLRQQEGEEIVECESCGRMLYLVEPAAPPAPQVAAAAAQEEVPTGAPEPAQE